jgi:hypothetical protein
MANSQQEARSEKGCRSRRCSTGWSAKNSVGQDLFGEEKKADERRNRMTTTPRRWTEKDEHLLPLPMSEEVYKVVAESFHVPSCFLEILGLRVQLFVQVPDTSQPRSNEQGMKYQAFALV